jgi:hypothetical protein
MTDSFVQEGAPTADAGKTSKRVLVISRRGPPPRPFGWEIRDAGGEIARSEETFRARYEAIADGQRALDSMSDVVRDR